VLDERYRIDAFIGQGGFGIAYLAERIQDHERVVIKEYLPRELARRSRTNVSVVVGQSEHRDTYDQGLQSFLNEARLLQQFDEPSIVRVLEVFQQNDTAYLVMPYAEGPTLSQVMKAGHHFSEDELRMILLQLLDGLRVVHAAGYLHRDIKPSNIIIRSGDHRPILIDFGAARQALVDRSRSLSAMLTPGYAPFEQYPGYSKRQGRWSDLYSLGVTLYQAITHCNEDTLEQGNANVRLEALHTGAPDPLAPAVVAGANFCSQELLGIIDWLMRPRIEDRPPAVEAVQECLLGRVSVPPSPLRTTVHRVPPSASDTTLIVPKPKPAATRNALLAVLGGFAAAVAAVAAGAWLFFGQPDKLLHLGSNGRAADLGGGSVSSTHIRQPAAVAGIQQSAPPSAAVRDAAAPLNPASDDSVGSDNPVPTSQGPPDAASNNPAGAPSGAPGDPSGGYAPPPAAIQPRRYTLTVNPEPADARVELLNGGRYRPGVALAPKRYRVRITAPHYQPFEASLVLRSDVTASVRLCPYITRREAPAEPVPVPHTVTSVENISDRIPIPTAPAGELVRRTEAMLCVRAGKDLHDRLTSRCQALGGQGAPLVSPCACQPVTTFIQGRYVVSQNCAVTGTVACSVSREVLEPAAAPEQPPPSRTVVDPSCPAPALSY
jgi:serine/threonine protein kinase